MKKHSRWIVFILALAGLGIMGYLTYIHYAQAKSFCDISEEISCDVVTTSIYSEIFRVPVSVLGLFYFATVLFLILKNKRNLFKIIFILTLFSLIPSLYLSLTELIFINSLCILCETSKILMLAILGVSLWMEGFGPRSAVKMSVPIIIAGVLAAGVTYFAQTGTIVKKDYSALAQCLNSKGVVYYKSVRCSNCRRQEMLFGEAYKKLNSIECHPDGKDPQPGLCLEKKITKTPTFLIEKQGKEIDRLEGLQKIENLASFANCKVE